jgi:putative membrane protein
MPETLEQLFSEEDRKRIQEAVAEAEKETGGEIVPYAVHASDPYNEALWIAGLLFGVVGVGVCVFLIHFVQSWRPFELTEALLGILGAMLGGILLTRYINPLKRFFAGKEAMTRRVAQRAAEAFLAEEVFDTRDRTGVLIFLSLFERKVLVLGDAGINAKVRKEQWEDIAATIVEGMRSGKPADGLVEAIRRCGKLLTVEEVTRRPDDTNELDNTLRTGKS